jgi:predicted aspartyl protease
VKGTVDEFGRAVIGLSVHAALNVPPAEVIAWVDTAFNGELVMPRSMIDTAGFPQSAGILARLADGNVVTLESFTCILDWFGEHRVVEVIANDGELPLLGIGLLLDH